MIEWGALALAGIKLIASIVDDHRATRPQREQAENDYDRDVQHTAHAAATGDAATLTMDFEAERQAAIRRGDLDPAPISDRRDRGAANDAAPAGELHQLP